MLEDGVAGAGAGRTMERMQEGSVRVTATDQEKGQQQEGNAEGRGEVRNKRC